MLKKSVSLLFVFMVFLYGSAFAAADIKTLDCIIKNNPAKLSSDIQNGVYFVRDYSKVITDICKNFVKDMAALSVSLYAEQSTQSFKKYEPRQKFAVAVISLNLSEKTVFAPVSFAGAQNIETGSAAVSFLFLVILSSILLYIGLLRLFDADTFFAKQIEV